MAAAAKAGRTADKLKKEKFTGLSVSLQCYLSTSRSDNVQLDISINECSV